MKTEISPEQAEFLHNRLLVVAEEQPAIRVLRERLLQIDGLDFVPPCTEPDLAQLLSCGQLQPFECVLDEMQENSCHGNAARLFAASGAPEFAIGTGYALSEDGLWRQHSWAFDGKSIIETTEVRVRYFGLLLRGEAAQAFVLTNQ